ncbi:sodium:solute symporter [Hugenholtzia roseola]|uniref:sodium:solute symporter n=1 Tax=Hugenholtzia roseola TaxID=1002 RepID=UPI0004293D6E|nr:sodium:solute symporter [Hugenholtzia roseola]
MLSPQTILFVLFGYFVLLLLIARKTAKGANTADFFNASRQAPWLVVAFGMIGASMSGVTFLSVPGQVGKAAEGGFVAFSYLQVVLGYLVGYAIIGTILLPLYYRLQSVSIYEYLETRFGFWTYKTGSAFFLLSRLVGSALRLFLSAQVLQVFVFDDLGLPFELTSLLTIALIWVYTFRGGIKTIIWTDTLQTAFFLLALVITIYTISEALGFESLSTLWQQVSESPYSQIFVWEGSSSRNFFKQFLGGIFIALTMTGLDQDMMQKNLSCRTLQDSQKNMFWFSLTLLIVNFFFLILGASLYLFAQAKGVEIPTNTDTLYPLIAKNHLGTIGALVFFVGIIAATYSSADSSLTALTTAFTVDFLGFNRSKTGEAQKRAKRIRVHLVFSLLTFLIMLIAYYANNQAVIDSVMRMAGYTYGPLLGLFAFGLLLRARLHDRLVPALCLLAPLLTYLLNHYSPQLFNGYQMGYELVLVNGIITFILLLFLIKKEK